MAQNPAPELSADLELPAFVDRLPDLVQVLRSAGESLGHASPRQSYLPYWEDIYAVAHSLKGVLNILACPPDLGAFIMELNELLLDGIAGPMVCRQLGAAGRELSALSVLLDSRAPEISALHTWTKNFPALYERDVSHEERLRGVPAHLVYVDDKVSKKAREIVLLGLNQCAAEDLILLDEIPFWRTRLNEALLSDEFGRGLVVNFLPFISSEGSRKLRVWAWVAAPTASRAALKQRIKEVLPKAQLTKL